MVRELMPPSMPGFNGFRHHKGNGYSDDVVESRLVHSTRRSAYSRPKSHTSRQKTTRGDLIQLSTRVSEEAGT
jgi:hypothetical protein